MNKKFEPVDLSWFLIAVVVLGLFATVMTYADDDCDYRNCDDDDENAVTVSTGETSQDQAITINNPD